MAGHAKLQIKEEKKREWKEKEVEKSDNAQKPYQFEVKSGKRNTTVKSCDRETQLTYSNNENFLKACPNVNSGRKM